MAATQLIRRLIYWTVPPGIQDVARGVRRQISAPESKLSARERAFLERNRVLHQRHRGERCFILATGPSIKQQDLTRLAGETCIAVSNFFVHPDFAVIKPRYYCVAPYHPPVTEEAWQSWLAEMEAATGDAVLFFSLADQERNRRQGRFRDRTVHFLAFGADWPDLVRRGVDLTKPVPAPQSVPVMALLVALSLGFREAYLLGCDHDWALHPYRSVHFYDESRHALHRAGYDEWYACDLQTDFQSYVNLWHQYKQIRELAAAAGVRVFNATEGGLLDVFPRVRYDDVLPGGRP